MTSSYFIFQPVITIPVWMAGPVKAGRIITPVAVSPGTQGESVKQASYDTGIIRS